MPTWSRDVTSVWTVGIELDRICLDPGIGFGKTHEHNLELLRGTRRFAEIGSPLLIGHSRKGFIGKVLGDKEADRTAATLGVSLAVAAAGADVIRVHDVKPTVDALKLFEADRRTRVVGFYRGERNGPCWSAACFSASLADCFEASALPVFVVWPSTNVCLTPWTDSIVNVVGCMSLFSYQKSNLTFEYHT